MIYTRGLVQRVWDRGIQGRNNGVSKLLRLLTPLSIYDARYGMLEFTKGG